jgi:hypothetical protein
LFRHRSRRAASITDWGTSAAFALRSGREADEEEDEEEEDDEEEEEEEDEEGEEEGARAAAASSFAASRSNPNCTSSKIATPSLH